MICLSDKFYFSDGADVNVLVSDLFENKVGFRIVDLAVLVAVVLLKGEG